MVDGLVPGDAMLRDLLVQAIAEWAACVGRDPLGGVTDTAAWATAVRLTGARPATTGSLPG
jgi:hypothetical protein